ncbi:MAG: LPS export ABC transporter periplasmic protein LptC [Proteobacteria bacterium]|nr:LPS export ABC transporter periplasmic protein LptC [Pseudomonadota bacterium]MBU1686056.1 LPS export ABC transporter periplasmic protein LptC [Pseudomonadota bacterium]
MNLSRNAVWLLPLVLCLTAPLWWPAAGNLLRPRGESPPELTETGQQQGFVMEKVFMTQERRGLMELELQAARVSGKVDSGLLLLEQVTAHLQDDQDQKGVITAGEAEYRGDQHILTLYDHVRAEIPTGYEIQTKAVRYLVKFRKVKTAETVQLLGPGITVKGEGLFYDLGSGRLRVGGVGRVLVDLS